MSIAVGAIPGLRQGRATVGDSGVGGGTRRKSSSTEHDRQRIREVQVRERLLEFLQEVGAILGVDLEGELNADSRFVPERNFGTRLVLIRFQTSGGIAPLI